MNLRLRYLTTGLPRILLTASLLSFTITLQAQQRGRLQDARFIPVETPPAATTATNERFEGIGASSEKIDELVGLQLSKDKLKPNAGISDEIFLRRVYLDVVGRVPNYHEAKAFLESKDSAKRQKLIHELLNSDGYVSSASNFWSDLLRIKSRLLPGGQSPEAGAAYMDWLKTALRENRPYDQMVRELLTADGAAYDNGAVGYYLRDAGMALDNMAVTTQIFLGTQMVCAQCHDHPFDKWTQMDYYQMAAHSSAMTSFNGLTNQREIFRELGNTRARGGERRMLNRAFNEILFRQRFTKIVMTDQKLRLPSDYAYENGKPGDVIHPLIPAGFGVSGKEEMIASETRPPIEAYAQWMTSKDNPRFTKVVANRLWKKLLGLGVIEPVDEFTDQTKAHNPELMTYLEQTMKAVNYDLRVFQEVILNSKTYQSQAVDQEINDPTSFAFQGPLLRRMSAEQIWDSIVSLVVENPDQTNLFQESEREFPLIRIRWRDSCLKALTPKELLEGAQNIVAYQRDLSQNVRKQAVERREGEKGEQRKGGNASRNQRRLIFQEVDRTILERGFQKIVSEIYENPEKAKAKYGDRTIAEIQSVLKTKPRDLTVVKALAQVLQQEKRSVQKDVMARVQEDTPRAWDLSKRDRQQLRNFVKLQERTFARANELRQPAPNGHFLRTYGQSDREIVDNYNHDASVMQALHMMNGTFFQSAMHPLSFVRQSLNGKSSEAQLEVLFLSTLSRKPSASEVATLQSVLDTKGKEGVGDALWTLLNTKQFIFIQ